MPSAAGSRSRPARRRLKESAQAALSFIRSHAETLGIEPNLYENTDLHVHLPAGAIPRWPVRGVTLCTAIVSLLTGRARAPASR